MGANTSNGDAPESNTSTSPIERGRQMYGAAGGSSNGATVNAGVNGATNEST